MPDLQLTRSERSIPTRRMSLDEELAKVPKHFAADGDLFSSHLTASLSAVFPDGEDFFVRSVRHFRSEVDDPVLKKQMGGFIGQEAIHGREHRAFNDHLHDLGYPVKRFERMTKAGLQLRERLMSPKSNLAATAALEHYTATLAEHVLSNEETRRLLGEEAVRDLFVWHALEESEHKAVAFDVYKAVGGSERTRVWTMNALTVGFLGGMAIQMAVSLLTDRDTYRPRTFWKSFRQFRRAPIFDRSVWRQLRDYNRPDFHPYDHDTEALLEQWRTELFGDEGTLNEYLAGAAA